MGKSSQIREILDEQPNLTPKEIQDELARRGIEASRNLCKVVRHRLRNGKQAKRKAQPPEETVSLRRGERRIGHRDVVRLSEEDLAIWDHLKAHAETLDDPALELHTYDGWEFEELAEVRAWIADVSTRKAKERRRAILEQFIKDLGRLYPVSKKRGSSIDLKSSRRGSFPPIFAMAPHSLGQDPNPRNPFWDHQAHEQAVEAERVAIGEYITTAVKSHDRIFELFCDPEIVEYLLSAGSWHRCQALQAIAKSYSIFTILDDLLELAWSSSKPINLPEILKQLKDYTPGESSASGDNWRNHPQISQILFLSALWLSRMIGMSKPDAEGKCEVIIQTLTP